MVDLIDKGTENIVPKFGCQGKISAYAIITSKKLYTYINLSDANTNVFIVFFTASHVIGKC